LDRAAVHAACLICAGFLGVLQFDSRLESIIEKGDGVPQIAEEADDSCRATATSGSFFVYLPSSAVFRVNSHRFVTGKHGLDPADGA
jgi:hypothetical protein